MTLQLLPGPPPPSPRHVRARRYHFTLYFLLVFLCATLLPALFAARALDQEGATLQIGVLVVWVFAWVALAVALFRFRCPQCGKAFHRTGYMLSAFNTRCGHCGLPLRPANDPPRR
jgi:hypothetical protein